MGFKGFFVFVLSFLLVISLIFTVASLSFNTLLSPEVYTKNLDDAGIYKSLDENIQNLSGGTFGFIDNSKTSIQEIVEKGITQIVGYINGKNDDITITADQDKEGLKDFFISKINNLSICKENNANYDSPCRPANMTSEQILNEYLKKDNVTIFEKDQVDFVELYGLSKGGQGRESLDRIRDAISIYKKVLYSLIAFSIFLILIILVSYKKEIGKGKRIVGINLWIAGLISVGIAFVSNGIFNKFLLDKVTGISLNSFIDLNLLVTGVYSSVFSKFLIYSAILIGAGIILIVFSSKKKGKKI